MTFPEELERIRWRQRVMAVPDGADWLAHLVRLFGSTCKAVFDLGLPDRIRRQL